MNRGTNNMSIRIEMLKKNLSQEEVGQRLGVSQQRISQLLKAKDLSDADRSRLMNAIQK